MWRVSMQHPEEIVPLLLIGDPTTILTITGCPSVDLDGNEPFEFAEISIVPGRMKM
jgi:hypothetical protein